MDGTVTSIYWECRSGCDRYHRGIDIANGCDTPIHAARAGTADTRTDPDGYGNYVVVDHDDGYETLYAHMESFAVSDGEAVDTGTVLGYEGTTGSSTGCHVHFEVRQQGNGESYEVKQFLPGQLEDAITHGTEIPYEMKALELDTTTDVLDGPEITAVPGQGDQVLTTEEAGDRFVAYSSWTNDDGATWYAAYVNGRVGWLPATSVTEVGATAERVQVDTALNVRAGPGTGHADIGNVYGAQEHVRLASQVDGNGDTWYEIHHEGTDGGETGWVHGGWTTPITYEDPESGDEDLTGYSITVDPGHGGDDPGGQGFGTDEKEVVLDIALELRDLLEADGATVLMTRTTDETVSLQERVDLANENGADRFLSVHANACGDCGAQGTETYYHDSLDPGSQAADLATHTQDHVVAEVGTTDRGVKQADFFVLRETTMPAILVETAFIDQADDHDLLTDPATQRTFAEAMLFGLQEHLGITPHLPEDGGDPDTTPPTVSLDSPADDASLPGPIHVEATASDTGTGVDRVEFLVDGTQRATDTTSPYTWSWAAADEPGGHTVTARAVDGAGNTASHTHTVTVVAGLDDGFEESRATWTDTDDGGPAAWERTQVRAHTGSYSLALSDYGADELDHLLSPEIDLTGADQADLEVASWMEGERACGLFSCTIYDHGRIQITLDGGDSWDTLLDDHWQTSGWETLTFELDAYTGHVVQLRFTFTSDGSQHNEGWYLDDVRVTPSEDGGGDPGTGGLDEDFEAGDPGWTVDDQGGSATWQLTEDRSSSPTHSIAIADYGADEADHLVTETVDLSALADPTLTVESWIEGERSCSLFFGCTIYDFGRLQVKATTQGAWTTLLTDYVDSDGWETLAYDLTDWSDQTIQVRFSFFSDGSVQNEGWYLDDVVIS